MTGRARCALRATAGVVVSDDQDRVLLMRRRTEDTWSLPGGGLEPGETWAAAAVRECLEETGWHVEVSGLLGVYSDPATQVHTYPSGRAYQLVGVVFRARALERTSPLDREACETGWFALGDLPAPIFPPDVPVLRDAQDPSPARPVIS